MNVCTISRWFLEDLIAQISASTFFTDLARYLGSKEGKTSGTFLAETTDLYGSSSHWTIPMITALSIYRQIRSENYIDDFFIFRFVALRRPIS